MSSHDEQDDPAWDWTGPTVVIAIAEGILVERYQIPAPVAAALLKAFAATARLSLADAARWLLNTGRLP